MGTSSLESESAKDFYEPELRFGEVSCSLVIRRLFYHSREWQPQLCAACPNDASAAVGGIAIRVCSCLSIQPDEELIIPDLHHVERPATDDNRQ
jgi:hypothetical protein